jgi:predicted RNase H-like HicB family nuclease
MKQFVYPAIFEREVEGGYSVSFPDIEWAHTCGDTLPEAIYMAEDCLGLVLYDYECDKKEFPKPSDISSYKNSKDKFASLIAVDLTEYKRKVDNRPVKKTLYIPKQLNDQAEAKSINFSELMRQALKKRLNMH